MLLYKELGIKDWELQRVIFGAAGGELPKPFEDPEESLTVDDIRRRASGDKYNDLVDIDDPEIMFDYEVE